MLGLDFSYFDLEVLRKFVLGGLLFSVQLTIVATIGGVIFGTLLALMPTANTRVWEAIVSPNADSTAGLSVSLGSAKFTDRAGNTHTADVLISGLGQLNIPHTPNFAGLEIFKGAAFHSARSTAPSLLMS